MWLKTAAVLLLAAVTFVTAQQPQCDCGARWKSPVVTTDYLSSDTIYIVSQMIARDEAQARGHLQVAGKQLGEAVDGMIIYPGTQTSPSGTLYVRIALFKRTLPYVVTNYQTITYAAVTGGSTIRWLNRYQQYRCVDEWVTGEGSHAVDPMHLDPYYYYFQSGARADIETFYCPFRLTDGTCCWYNSTSLSCTEPSSSSDGRLTDTRFVNQTTSHWFDKGIFLRDYWPREACKLTPTIWDPTEVAGVRCGATRFGCFDSTCDSATLDDTICGGHGYCVQTNLSNAAEVSLYSDYLDEAYPYHCECHTSSSAPFNGYQAWGSLFCDVALDQDLPLQACGANMCGYAAGQERPEACHLARPADGSDYGLGCTTNYNLQNLCDCSNTTWTGDFCTVSQCGSLCISSAGTDACHASVTMPGDYVCACPDGRYGDSCQYTNIKPGCCNDPDTCQERKSEPYTPSIKTVACNGYGDPTYNATSGQCYCDCDAGRGGALCQLLLCDANLLNQTLTTGISRAADKATCNPTTGEWTCLPTWNTTRNATGGAPYGLCNELQCPGALGVDPLNPSVCDCDVGYGAPAIGGDPRCYQLCPNNCGESDMNSCLTGTRGQCSYNTTALTCSCFCQGVFVNDAVNGCEEYCISPYAVPTGSGSGTDPYYTTGHKPLANNCNPTGSGGFPQCQCNCNSSWTGTRCRTDVNECSTIGWCANGGTCTNLVGSYSCACASGYSGPRCQTAPAVSSSSSSSSTGAASSSTAVPGSSSSSSTAQGSSSSTASHSSSTASLTNSSSSSGSHNETVVPPVTTPSSSDELSTGAIIGIAAGSTVGGIGVISGLVYYFRVSRAVAVMKGRRPRNIGSKRKKSKSRSRSTDRLIKREAAAAYPSIDQLLGVESL